MVPVKGGRECMHKLALYSSRNLVDTMTVRLMQSNVGHIAFCATAASFTNAFMSHFSVESNPPTCLTTRVFPGITVSWILSMPILTIMKPFTGA